MFMFRKRTIITDSIHECFELKNLLKAIALDLEENTKKLEQVKQLRLRP